MLAISLRLRNIRFEFNIGFAVLVLAVCAVMLRAGFWQLDRAAEKIRMQQQIETARGQPVLHIFGDLPAPESLRYRQIRIGGYYQGDRQFLLDNRIRSDAGHAHVGYHVITPFVTDAGILLVDRGWVPLGEDRSRLPEVAVDTAERNVTGIITLPGQGFRLGSIDSGAGWPRLIQFVDYELLGQRLGAKVYPAVIVLAGGSADGFEYNWKPAEQDGPQKHYSYATQWFLMCGAMVLLFIWFSARRIDT